MGEPVKAEIPTQQISRAAFFNLKATSAIGRFTHKLVMFPVPGCASTRLAHFTDTPVRSFSKHALIGTAIGLFFGIGWKIWHRGVYDKRRDDYYHQLAIANKEEMERFRLRLVEEGKQRRGE